MLWISQSHRHSASCTERPSSCPFQADAQKVGLPILIYVEYTWVRFIAKEEVHMMVARCATTRFLLFASAADPV